MYLGSKKQSTVCNNVTQFNVGGRREVFGLFVWADEETNLNKFLAEKSG